MPEGGGGGVVAQIVTVLVAVPTVSIAKNRTPSFLEVDWLHFIEAALFWASIHVQCMSFRQAVRSAENGESLPVSLDVLRVSEQNRKCDMHKLTIASSFRRGAL